MNILFGIIAFILASMIGAVIGVTYSTNRVLKHNEAEYYVLRKDNNTWSTHIKD